MTAKADNKGDYQYAISCTECPRFKDKATGQLATVAICAAHDLDVHLKVPSPTRQWPSVRDAAPIGAALAAVSVSGIIRTVARREAENTSVERTAFPTINETNNEMSK